MRVSKVARGLVELLRLRPLGENPPELEDRLRATVDVTEMYGSDLLVVANDVLGAGAIGRTMTGNASGYGRLLQSAGHVTVGAAAGTFVKITVLFTPGPQFSAVAIGERTFNGAGLAAGALLRCPSQLTKPIVFGPGAQFIVEVQGDAAGADHQIFGRHLFENYTL